MNTVGPMLAKNLTQKPGERPDMSAIEDALYKSSLEVMGDMMRFREVTPDQLDPPEHWVAEMGEQRAREALRVAQASWMNQKDVPAGIALTAKVMVGMANVRSKIPDRSSPVTVNVVQLPSLDATLSRKVLGDGT